MHVSQRYPGAVDPDRPGGEAEGPSATSITTPATTSATGPAADLVPSRSAPLPVGPDSTCTVSQLRRFIKSRPYVPMHELRRRFELNGDADEVCALATPDGVVYLGLPRHETELIGELLRQGEIGLELCSDPRAPIVVGVYAMRPVARA